MKPLFFCLAALLAFLPAALIAEENTGQPIRMGVREDVPPFVWKDPLSDEFRGFFWDICTSALVRAGYSFEKVLIDATQRAELLETGSYCAEQRTDGEKCEQKQSVDLLCDPTTITLERMRVFAMGRAGGDEKGRDDTVKDLELVKGDETQSFIFSPILYLANGSFIRQAYSRSRFRDNLAIKLEPQCSKDKQIEALYCPDQEDSQKLSWLIPPAFRNSPRPPTAEWPAACDSIISALGKHPDANLNIVKMGGDSIWPPQIWPEPKPEKPQFEIWGYVKGATIGPAILEAAKRAPNSVAICPQAFSSHTEATNAFCAGHIYRYFGDVDLVRARVEAFRTANAQACPADESPSAQGTYEPYALVLSHARKKFPEEFNLALYSMFSDGTVTQFFDGRFGKGRQSQYLETLFRINSLPSGRPFMIGENGG